VLRVLQVCHKMPFPLKDGGAVSIYNTAAGLLNLGVSLKIFAVNTPKNLIKGEEVPDDFKNKTQFESEIIDTGVKPVKAFMNLFSNKSYFVTRFYSKKFENRLIKILKKQNFDIVQLEHVYLGLYIDTIRKHSNAKIVLRPQNVESQLWKRYLENVNNPLKKYYLEIATQRLFKFERKTANSVDGIMGISPNDSGVFSKWVPKTPVSNIPVGYEINTNNVSSPDFFERESGFPVFYHLGSMDWLPNVQAVKWFISDVIPIIKKSVGNFRFRIAGKNMPEYFYKLKNASLIVDGEIEDPRKYQSDKQVMIVPLLSGGGIRVKIIEGMVLGKVVISTPLGAEGIPYSDGVNILIADSKEEFAKKIVECINSWKHCTEIGKNARLLASQYFDRSKLAEKMILFYEDVISKT